MERYLFIKLCEAITEMSPKHKWKNLDPALKRMKKARRAFRKLVDGAGLPRTKLIGDFGILVRGASEVRLKQSLDGTPLMQLPGKEWELCPSFERVKEICKKPGPGFDDVPGVTGAENIPIDSPEVPW